MIRPATDADVAAVARLHLAVALVAYAGIFPPDAPKPTVEDLENDWRHWLAQHDGFVAERQGAIVGVIVARSDDDDPSFGHLSRLYVEHTLWGQGIGRALHDAALDRLRACGYQQASLWVLEHNHRVRGWYERLGWTATTERKPVYEPAGVDDVRYTRALP